MQGIMQRLRNTPTSRDTLTRGDFSFSTGSQGVRSQVAEYKPSRLISLSEARPLELSIVAVERKTTDGSGTAQTFTLSHDLIDSNAIAESLALYADGAKVQPDSVDYGADSFTYTDDGTVQELVAYYTSGTQALVEVQKTAPGGSTETLFSADVGSLHRRETAKTPLSFDFKQSPLQPVVPTDYRLEVYVNAPYTAAYTYSDNDGNESDGSNAALDVPIRGAGSSVDGAKRAVSMDMARR